MSVDSQCRFGQVSVVGQYNVVIGRAIARPMLLRTIKMGDNVK